MNMKSFAILAAVCAVSAANAITFTASGDVPKFTTAGNVVTPKTASQVGNAYVVNGLPFSMTSPGGNFSWDFYAQATPGAHLTGVTFTFTFTGGAGALWTRTGNAKYVIGNSEYSIGGSTIPLTALSSPGLQTMALPGTSSKWHLYITDTFVLPAGVTLTGIKAEVTEAVPEPASMAALAIGGLGLLGRRRRKA